MAGLFDFLSNEDPNQAAQLAMAAGLLGGRGSFNEILGKSLMAGQAEGQRAGAIKRQAQLDELARQRFQLALDEENRKKQAYDAQEKFRRSIQSPDMVAAQTALAGGGGPTLANAANMPPVSPDERLMHGALQAGAMTPMEYLASRRKDTTPIKLGRDERLLTATGKEIVGAAPEKDPEAIRQLKTIYGEGTPEYVQALQMLGTKLTTHQPAPTQIMNAGEKGFKNELDLKNNFKSEPIYKDYQDMQSAYKQIKAGIAAANPVGDLATATKVMKLLDPGSVVRESELGMAMAASGRMDRMKNYIDMQLKGTKLTPTQRQEFSDLADNLFEAAGQSYNQKRAEYEGIGKRYQLDTSGLGAPHKPIQNVAPTGIDPSLWKFMTPEERALWQKN